MVRKRINCEYDGCCRSYCSSFNLKRHIESSHFGLRKFKCPSCSKLLSSKQNLIDHQNIHTGAKPYICDIPGCSQHFRQLSQFYLHKQLHSEVSSHLCKSYNIVEGSLQVLVSRLSQEYSINTYKIPTLPYSSTEIPKITSSQYPILLPLFDTIEIEQRKFIFL